MPLGRGIRFGSFSDLHAVQIDVRFGATADLAAEPSKTSVPPHLVGRVLWRARLCAGP